MKTLFLLPFLIFGLNASATNYYISAKGNDASNGTSPSSPWQSLNKLNASFSSLRSGDNIYFNRGDVFYGSIVINISGTSVSPITIGAYGTGAKPVITGFTTISSWTNLGSNIWKSTNAVSSLPYTNMVAVNGVNTAMGRTPNEGTYYTYQSHTGSGYGASSSITSSSLTGTPNWTGAELALWVSNWAIGRNVITSQSGSRLNYTSASIDGNIQSDGQKFIIQNDARTLDAQNEWYYNPSTKKLKMYSISTPLGVQISTIDTLVYLRGSEEWTEGVNYITFNNISFQGSNMVSMLIRASQNIAVQNCDFMYAGRDAIFGPYWGPSTGLAVTNCTFDKINSNAIDVSGNFNNAVIQGNTIRNAGIQFGMGGNGSSGNGMESYSGILTGGVGSLIKYNIVDSTGYNQIRFFGSNSIIENNFLNHSNLILPDGAAIYTDNDSSAATGIKVRNNVLLNGATHGIYTDAQSNGIEVSGNSIANFGEAGLYLNNSFNLNTFENTVYNCKYGLLLAAFNYVTYNIAVNNNIFIAKTATQLTRFDWPSEKTILAVSSDNNYYARPMNDSKLIQTQIEKPSYSLINRSLPEWQAYSLQDLHSKKSPKAIIDIIDLRFESNATTSDKTVTLDARYVDVTGKSYFGIITLSPYSSVVLIRDGAVSNQPPKANAGANKTLILPTNSTSLSGSGSDTDGTISNYLWTKVSGPSTYKIVNSSSTVTDATGLVEGVYQFELRITDDKGAEGRDTIQITVNAAVNIPPTANAGANETIILPASTISLSGSGSDADGTISNYLWTKTSGPSTYNIVNAGSPITDVTGLTEGIYQFQLKVMDNKGATATSTVQITVNATANIAPTANAGANKTITLPTNTTSLSGSGSDADGTVSNYLWTKISGPSTYYIVNAGSPITDVTGLTEGIYQFQLKVTDNKGAAATSTVQITVNAATNIPPTANAGANKTITLPTNSISLSGSGNDADGTISNYLWTKISGPSTYKIVNTGSPITDVTGLIEGIYQFQLKITDNKGAIATSTVQITVNAATNITPIANAGANKTITLPTNSTSLSGSGSDADGTINNYLWTKTSGPSTYNIVNAGSPITDVTGLTEGIYQFQLKITDNKGATATSTVQIIVNAAANISPTANAGANKTITLPTNSTSLSGSGRDADGTISNYLWTKTSGPSTYKIVNAGSPVTDVSGLGEGIYQFQLKITDNKGATATSSVQITVNAAAIANIPPLANAGANKRITLPINSTSLSGSGSDADGTISNYLWTKSSGPSTYKIVNAGSLVTDVSGLGEGIYQFQLKITDNKGATATSSVQITVNAAAIANIPPLANAGANKTITLPTNSTSLSGSGSDADGTISNYLWTKTSGPLTYKIVNAGSPITDVTGLTEGIYQFQLKITDNKGATATSTVQITVNSATNILPIANAGADKTITLPINSTSLSGSGSDADGTISNYLWTKTSGPSKYKIANVSSPVTEIKGLEKGIYQFELKVTDNKGATAVSSVQVNVNAAINVSPRANAGANKKITLPTSTTSLAGSGSDTDGNITNYRWTKTTGPSKYSIINAESPVTDVTGLEEGVYQFALEVTDNNGAVATAIVEVTVSPADNISPTASAGANKTITLPTNSISLTGSANDEDGTIINYVWTKISGPSGYNIVNASSPVTDVTGLEEGVYQFELKVIDNSGAVATSTVEVTVSPAANIPPIASAGANKTITLPANTTSLAGSGSDTDGTISNYLWTKISGPSTYNIVNAGSPVTDVAGLEEGIYQFELKVTDNKGAISTSTVQVVVNAAPLANISPIANAGTDVTITVPVNSANLSGNGMDADGTITKYQWKQISGPSEANITSIDKAETSVNNLFGGTYEFEFTVKDNKGATAKDTMVLVVALGRISSQEESNGLKVYPNPVRDLATIEVRTAKPSTDLQMVVTSLDGRIIYRKVISSVLYRAIEKINMSNFAKGFYNVTVYFDVKNKQTFKVVKL